MSAKTLEEKELEHRMNHMYHQDSLKNWRAWGSWFSWGSPVGLGLFFIETAAAAWIIAEIFQ